MTNIENNEEPKRGNKRLYILLAAALLLLIGAGIHFLSTLTLITPEEEPKPTATMTAPEPIIVETCLSTPDAWTGDIPNLDLSGEQPVVTLTEEAQLTEGNMMHVVKEGTGAIVHEHEEVALHYVALIGSVPAPEDIERVQEEWGYVPASGDVVDHNFGNEPMVAPLNSLHEGFRAAIVGQPAGSIVLVASSPECGAPTAAPEGYTNPLEGATMVYLVEIISAQ